MIIFDNVSKTYGNGVKGLDHINLTIEDGEFVSIIGLSGAGKSTLLRSINRLNDVSEGEITINGVSVKAQHCSEKRSFRPSWLLFHMEKHSGTFFQRRL